MKSDIIIRETAEKDYSTIYDLIETAFKTAEHRDGTEQDFAVKLRESENYIPALDLTAVKEGQLIGHIMFTSTYVTLPDGSRYSTLMVAPLSVLLEYRNAGVGKALMKEGLCIAEKMGYKTAFLVGDPNYYERFGYRQTDRYDIRHKSIPAEYVLVKEITPEALNGISGVINL